MHLRGQVIHLEPLFCKLCDETKFYSSLTVKYTKRRNVHIWQAESGLECHIDILCYSRIYKLLHMS